MRVTFINEYKYCVDCDEAEVEETEEVTEVPEEAETEIEGEENQEE
jgi:hypothetical protein